jgi:hypothetical protein
MIVTTNAGDVAARTYEASIDCTIITIVTFQSSIDAAGRAVARIDGASIIVVAIYCSVNTSTGRGTFRADTQI